MSPGFLPPLSSHWPSYVPIFPTPVWELLYCTQPRTRPYYPDFRPAPLALPPSRIYILILRGPHNQDSPLLLRQKGLALPPYFALPKNLICLSAHAHQVQG